MKKISVLVLFGGQSTEHEVSCLSAIHVLNSIDKNRYHVISVGITKQGKWLYHSSDLASIANGKWINEGKEIQINPQAEQNFIEVDGNLFYFDVVFPVLHGKFGEDGTIQGFLDLKQVPYVGCNLLSSALAMDKAVQKTLGSYYRIPQAKYLVYHRLDHPNFEEMSAAVETTIGYPCFVKPANGGSTIGISKACHKAKLQEAITEAFYHDEKILIEEQIVGREIEMAILGGRSPYCSGLGEITYSKDFYDYEAKYQDDRSQLLIPADILPEIADQARRLAITIWKALDCYGIARADFFLTENGVLYFNELNTMPGFTEMSMYTKLLAYDGFTNSDVIHRLIELALEKRNV